MATQKLGRIPVLLLGVALFVLPTACKKKEDKESSAPKVFEVKELGVKLTAPGDWSLKQRGGEWVLMGGMKGVIIRRQDGAAPSSPEEAAKRFPESKILASEKLPSGAIYLFYASEFPSEEGSMTLKFVHSVVASAKGGAVTCQVQLQADDEQALYEPICKSLAPL